VKKEIKKQWGFLFQGKSRLKNNKQKREKGAEKKLLRKESVIFFSQKTKEKK